MTKILSPDTKLHIGVQRLAAGIDCLLADHSKGRRDRKWLAERSNLSKTSLYRKLGDPGSLDADDLFAIADAFDVDLDELYRVGAEALDARRDAA
ncbi:helix-turn-helix domain-containing protein [Microbacterium allomyrinae]|uniref:Helix-turn-helix transcriptional regulator n=1 Tax=Microbacterium allomyrinae TaxID=2830666 RepID=A0A9X1LRH1_9MICO|nr:helix-turn-helix transcriptional regulator [Microbacterium allomyrinae]MCC2030649.1 helix-turn-helix transcriptional regulator [Microbacterium allomyrinae]